MTQRVYNFIILLLVSRSFCDDELECGKINAEQTDCANECEINKCPLTETYSMDCKMSEKCAAGCKCRFNEKLAANGTCIQTTDCPPFVCDRPNEEYVACPPYCSEQCSEATPFGRCPSTFGLLLMVEECSPRCRCKDGFWRKSGNCVPYAECQKH